MSHKTKIAQCVISAFVLLNLSACSSDTPPEPEPPQVNQAKVFNGPLGQTSSTQVEQFIKNGIYATSIIEVSNDEAVSILASPGENSVTSGDNFSQTNTVEQGVDESDRVKYDGNYMYVAETGTYYLTQPLQPKVRVLKRNQDFTLTPLTSISSSLEFERINGIYLHENKLAVLGTTVNFYFIEDNLSNRISFPAEAKVSISIFDVTNPEQTTESAAIQLDGVVLATRRIENSLYIISTYTPRVENLTLGANTDTDKIDNFSVVSQTPIEQLMPKLYQDGQQRPLNNPEDCYIPTQATSQDGYAQFLNVTKVNLDAPTEIQSTCLTTIASTLYMSPDNLYLAVNVNNQDTLFHKIDLTTLDYSASGSVEGQLGWRGNPLFRMHENDNLLRVVTTDYNQADPLHSLSILQQQGSDLTAIATLPNDTAPEAIGKPGEDIYAVRFIGEKAYVVTFQNIDPLYVINLSDGTRPFIEGELEIPGFSNYIQPLDNGYLLGIGQQVSINILPQVGGGAIIPPQIGGMKISLFDVRDPANPLELSSLVTSNSFTPIEFNYKALSVLNTNGAYQFALPLEEWGNFDSDNTSSDFIMNRNSLMLLETDTTNNAPELSLIHKVTVLPNTDFYFYAGDDRSIIQGDKVYYLRGNQVWLSDWSQDSATLGPY
ncbi:MAG: putative secreted protein with C-terminal beta-propeller domain [Alphaproteobacteria bacterium]|jgi:uncharacterized secreted protein with C-terminal beta-propeller domain